MSDEDRDIDIESDVNMEEIVGLPDFVKSACLQSTSLTFFQLTSVHVNMLSRAHVNM